MPNIVHLIASASLADHLLALAHASAAGVAILCAHSIITALRPLPDDAGSADQ